MERPLEGQAALVTGGSKGIGRSVAGALARAGANVAIVGRDDAGLARAADEIRAAGVDCAVITADLARAGNPALVVSEARTALGRLDVLVNSAGTVHGAYERPADAVDEQAWTEQMDLMLKAVFFASQAAGRIFVNQRSGRVINIASSIGIVGYPNYVVYAAAKAGVIGLTKTLAVEWAPHGVTVNAVAPHGVRTEANAYLVDDPEILKQIVAPIPAHRLVPRSEVAAAVVYLASAEASLVNGHTLVIDGAFTVV